MDIEDPLVAEYRKTFSEKLKLFREHIEAVKREQTIESLNFLRRDAHKLAGSSGTYGFMAASILCRNLDLDLQDKIKHFSLRIFSSEWLKGLDHFLKELEKALVAPDKKIKF